MNGGEIDQQSLIAIILAESKLLRWRLVPLMGILGFGTFYNLDIPGAIGMGDGDTIQSRFIAAHLADLSSGNSTFAVLEGGAGIEEVYSNAMNQRLYSMYYYPNTVFPLVSGILIDKMIGPRNAVMLFCTIVMLGSFIFATGVTSVNYSMMVLGRLVIGIAAETTMVIRSYYISRFFKRGSDIRGVALAFGIAVGCSRMGSVLTFPMTVTLAGKFGVPAACYAGTLASLFTLCCGLVVNRHDAIAQESGIVPEQAHIIAKNSEKETREQTHTLKRLTLHDFSVSVPSAAHTVGSTAVLTPPKQRTTQHHISLVCAEPKVQEALVVADNLGSTVVDDDEDEVSGLMKLWNTLADRFHPKRFKLNMAYWAACLTANFFFTAVFPFFAFAKPFFEVKWGVSESTAVTAIALYQCATVIGCPGFGLLSDRIGRNSVMFFVGAVGAFCMHLLLATSFISPIMILLVYGSCHGLFLGALQPAVALLVNPDEVGLAFGIYSALNCLGVSLVPPIVGYILDKNTQNVMLPSGDVTTKTDVNGYIQAEYVLLSFVGVSVLLSIVFLIADQKILQGVVFATPAERLEIFRLKDGAQAHADGNKKEEMEQRIRDAADALLTAYSQRLTTKNGDVSEVKPLDASIGGRVIEADVTTMDVEDVHRIYSSMSVEPLSAS